MKIVNILLGSCLILWMNSCRPKTPHELESKYLTSSIDNLHIKNNIKYVVILPGLGCEGCIQEGEAFMKEAVKNKNIFFILTNIESLKVLKAKIGIDVKDYSNIYVDKNNEVTIPSDNKIYPCIITVKSGKVKAHEFQCPENSQAFAKLESRMRFNAL